MTMKALYIPLFSSHVRSSIVAARLPSTSFSYIPRVGHQVPPHPPSNLIPKVFSVGALLSNAPFRFGTVARNVLRQLGWYIAFPRS